MPHPLRTHLTVAQIARLLGANHVTIWRQYRAGAFGPVGRLSHTIKIPLAAVEIRHGYFTRDQIESACVDRL
jgi:hypothetical protein